MPFAIVLILVSLTLGCTTTKFVAGSNNPATTRSTQRLQMIYDGAAYEMLGVLETSISSTSLAILSPTGLLLFSIHQTRANASTQKHPDIPTHLNPMRVLDDVQLINWPTISLLQTLDSSTVLIETDNVRSLYRNDILIKTATFTPNAMHWQQAVLLNHELNYTLKVQLLSTEVLTAANS